MNIIKISMTSLTPYGLLLYVILSFFISTPASSQQIKIVGHLDGPPAQLDSKELRSIFKAQKQWWDNDTKISIVLLKSSVPISGTIADKVFAMTKNEVKTYWIQIVFRGKAATPKHLDSEGAVVDYVASTPGAIGVVSADTDIGSLKIIPVDGKEVW